MGHSVPRHAAVDRDLSTGGIISGAPPRQGGGSLALMALIPIALTGGIGMAGRRWLHTALLEYIPFILLLLALFTVAGACGAREHPWCAADQHGAAGDRCGDGKRDWHDGAAMIMIRP